MADLTRNNPQPQPRPQPWLPLQIPLHQLSFTYIHTPHQFSCMALLSPFFPQLNHNFFRHPSIFPARPQGFIPPAGYASTTPYINIINSCGLYHFTQPGYGPYGDGSRFFRPYGYQYLPSPQPQPKVNGFLQTRTTEQQGQQNRILPYQSRIFGLVRRGTGVFYPRDINHVPRNNRRRRRRGRRNNNREVEVEATPERSTDSSQEDGLGQQEECTQHPPYEMVLPNEWPY